jgi:hypothetical protein
VQVLWYRRTGVSRVGEERENRKKKQILGARHRHIYTYEIGLTKQRTRIIELLKKLTNGSNLGTSLSDRSLWAHLNSEYHPFLTLPVLHLWMGVLGCVRFLSQQSFSVNILTVYSIMVPNILN